MHMCSNEQKKSKQTEKRGYVQLTKDKRAGFNEKQKMRLSAVNSLLICKQVELSFKLSHNWNLFIRPFIRTIQMRKTF